MKEDKHDKVGSGTFVNERNKVHLAVTCVSEQMSNSGRGRGVSVKQVTVRQVFLLTSLT